MVRVNPIERKLNTPNPYQASDVKRCSRTDRPKEGSEEGHRPGHQVTDHQGDRAGTGVQSKRQAPRSRPQRLTKIQNFIPVFFYDTSQSLGGRAVRLA